MSSYVSIPIGELMAQRRESIDPSESPDEHFDLYSIPAYDSQEPENLRGSEIGSSKKVVKSGDVLLSRIIPHIRRAWVVGPANGRRKIGSGEWMIFDSKQAWPGYLRHLVMSDWFHPQLMQTVSGVGGSLLRARPSEVAKIEIPLPHKNGKPDLDEQKRIASILDKADAIRHKRQQSQRLTEDLLRAVFLAMFGDQEARGWSITTVEGVALGEKGSIRTGPFGSQLLHSEFVDDGIAVLGIDNAVTNQFAWAKPRFITRDKYAELKRYTVHPGDVLITIMGTCGRCAVVPDDIPTAINTKHLCCITLDHEKCLPAFLHAYFLIHPLARRYLALHSKGAIMDGLNMGIIKDLPVPGAPIALQREFTRIVTKLSATNTRLTIQSNEADDLFLSLQQRAFRGEL